MNVVKVMRDEHGMVLGSGDLSTNTYRLDGYIVILL